MKYLIAAVLVVSTIVAARAYSRPVTTCQWPNTCGASALELPTLIQKNAVAQFQPCVWPNRCVTAM